MITQLLFRALDKKAIWLVVALVVIAIAIPFANLVIPEGNPLHIPNYAVPLFGKYLNYAMLALALDLVWGYCGILSLGHAAFFALGAYAMGMYLMRQIGARGVYANPVLPDFMVFLNYHDLPWFWHGFDQWWFAFAMVVLVPGALAFAFGWFAFRSRVTGVYLSIITQAMTYALLLAFFRNDLGLGGNNGLTDFKDILGFNVQAATTRAALFAISALALALAVVICSAIVNSKLGKVMVAVRDAESRTRFLGWRPENVKLFAFVVSAVLAGIAGALYTPQVGIINPGEFDPANSIEAVIWVAVGGRGTIVGPIIGAVLVNAGKSIFTGAFPDWWLYCLGGLFIFVTLFMPKGIVGLFNNLRSRKVTQASAAAEAGEDPSTLPQTRPSPEPAE
ncbi:MAG: amino acid transporter permease [Devosia sp.]|uniref:urea ABC transporter permease subunit UrtC n=1 Tax=Devosia sp. TaxID=1871048 RepID=UPI0026127187|nr:urea ABC transporter permease subunit UrtC [Devosia sp.]MDB5541502.1 amino acid transporter permease [Devosia sp.]